MTQLIFHKHEADPLLSKAKISVMMDARLVFFSVLMMNMRYAWHLGIPTAATDGRTIYINPIAYALLTPGQRVSRLMHEVMHVALSHLKRRGTRDASKWNRACDYYINLMLTDQGFEKISTWLWDEKYRGMSAEQIYDLLPDEPELGWEIDLMPIPQDDDEPFHPDQHQYAMDQLIVQAAMQAQKSNCTTGIPSSISFYLDALLHPKLRWDIVLKRWFGQYIKKGYTWKKPSKRYEQYMPSRGKPSLDEAAFATDISVSVSDKDYQVIVSEVGGVLDRMKPKFIHYIQFSEIITSINKVKTVNELKAIKFKGRGGTDVNDLFNWAEKNQPKVLVILTDGGFYWPREGGDPHDEDAKFIQPSCDMVWLIHNNPQWTAPYGKVIHYEIKHAEKP